ncbi:MAG: AAA family ATPase [Candidatus Saccharimonadaceae bacterium]
MADINFSKFEIVYKDRISKSELLTSLNFLKSIEIDLKDITDENQKANYQKVVIATYKFQGKTFSSKPLFYKNILHAHSVKNADSIVKYFEDDVFWLDLDEHDWPKPKGETEIESLIIDDITDDHEFKLLLKRLANNQNRGVLQRITLEGKTNQYYRNFENNNHWHDIIILLKQIIKNKPVDKKYFSPLIFRWDGNKNTNRERVSLSSRFGSRKFIDCLIKNVKELSITNPLDMNTSYIDLLNYKKQIILQGPPGTGKTKLAKEIAGKLIDIKINGDKPLTNQQIIDALKDVKTISTVAGNADYKLVNVDVENQQVILEKPNEAQDPSSFNQIKESYRTKSFLSNIQGNPARRVSAIANYIYQNTKPDTRELEDYEQFKLIQFHPSYTYEDLVRGIEAKFNGNQIEYKSVNKILGLFATQAHQNYIDSKKTVQQIKDKISFEEKLEVFKQKVEEAIAKDGKYQIGDTQASIFEISDENFTYSFINNPTLKNNLLFSDLTKLNQLNPHLKTTKEVFELEAFLKNKGKQTYYLKVITAIDELVVDEQQNGTVILEKKYVLIIDEINRANLSSVLGELIYALEYRGEEVESMYEADGSNKLVLPPNLYIIGTMNTADRSVGHIDYAIRRRFAFVDVLPKDLTDEPNIKFDKVLFNDVAQLFIEDYAPGTDYSKILQIKRSKYLSEEFSVKDVWLGQSYFIDKSIEGGNMQTRLDYEIKPILLEYVKDGVLKESAINEIEQLKTTI